MLSLQSQIKNLKQVLKNKNDPVKFNKEKDKEDLNDYLINEMFKEDIDDEPITLQEALNFEISYINNKNNKISSIRESKFEKKTKIEL
jgi:hypothetical protein